MSSPRRGTTWLLAAALSGSFLLGGGTRVSLALFTDSEDDPGTLATAVSFATTWYLHNEPTPPTANTNSQTGLPLDRTAPTADTLRNYDADRDAAAGLLIAKGGSGAGEVDLTKYQNWRTAVLTGDESIDGTATLDFWSAIKDFSNNKDGQLTAFLRDFNPSGSTYTSIGSATLDVANWQGGSGTWVNKTLTIAVNNYTVAAGHRIELKLIFASTAADDVWLAYDTTAHPSFLVLP